MQKLEPQTRRREDDEHANRRQVVNDNPVKRGPSPCTRLYTVAWCVKNVRFSGEPHKWQGE